MQKGSSAETLLFSLIFLQTNLHAEPYLQLPFSQCEQTSGISREKVKYPFLSFEMEGVTPVWK
jgi:hypothetical protein